MNSIYVIDTSALIVLSQYYPKDVFSTLWDSVEDLINKENIVNPLQVLK